MKPAPITMRCDGLVIGDLAAAEFAQAREAFCAVADGLAYCATMDEAWQLLDKGAAPVWFVLVQCRPGALAAEDVEQLQIAAPLARVVALLGSFCEGETRTGAPWPGVARVYAHAWPPQLMQALTNRRREVVLGVWDLPPTASDVERLLAGAASELPAGEGRTVVVCSPRVVMAETLAGICRRAGWVPRCLSSPEEFTDEPITAVVWDGDDVGAAELAEIAAWRQRASDIPIVVTLDFPRAGDIACLRAAGATAVLGKPFVIADLCASIAHKRASASDAAR